MRLVLILTALAFLLVAAARSHPASAVQPPTLCPAPLPPGGTPPATPVLVPCPSPGPATPTPAPIGPGLCADWLTPDGRFVGLCLPDTPSVPGTWQAVELPAGCSNVVSTFPRGTSPETVLRSMTYPFRVMGIWRYDPARGRFLGWSLRASLTAPEANDLTELARLDALWVCVTQPATLYRPPA